MKVTALEESLVVQE
jgi:hypothetical protein